MTARVQKQRRMQILEESLPRFEQFIESREGYIRALEKTIEALTKENSRTAQTNLAIRSSIDELVATQHLANIISTARDPEQIVAALIDLARQVVPVVASNIFLFQEHSGALLPLSATGDNRLEREAAQQMESGIIDWVIAEKKTIVVPDLEHMVQNGSARIFVIVPLILRGEGIGVYLIHTEKAQQEFTNQDIQLLSVLANQAAVGVEHWRATQQLTRAHAELQASQTQMVQAAKLAAIGELAAGIAHEIKNPLQVLMLHLELVQNGKPLPNWVEMFSKQVKRLSDLTLRLMNFARSTSEEVAMQPVSVNRVMEEIVAIVEHDWENSGVVIEKHYQENLPSVTGNANYLQQVFLNILINARDAMSEGGMITISTALTGFFISIRIADTGPGIAREIQEKIFKPFFTTKGEKGTGLGLAICAKIVAQHKGEIRIDSEPGMGTSFTIFLPVWRAQQ